MELDDVLFQGPPIDDQMLLDELHPSLRELLTTINGFVAFRGALHVRGACHAPAWHSLRAAWKGPDAFAQHYESVRPSDIPFAQDCVGDQFLLRDGIVFRLSTETDDIEPLNVSLAEFLDAACADPDAALSREPLLLLEEQGGSLEPGQLVNVYPPFATKEAADGVDVKAIPIADRLGFLATFARSVRTLADGGRVKIVTSD